MKVFEVRVEFSSLQGVSQRLGFQCNTARVSPENVVKSWQVRMTVIETGPYVDVKVLDRAMI